MVPFSHSSPNNVTSSVETCHNSDRVSPADPHKCTVTSCTKEGPPSRPKTTTSHHTWPEKLEHENSDGWRTCVGMSTHVLTVLFMFVCIYHVCVYIYISRYVSSSDYTDFQLPELNKKILTSLSRMFLVIMLTNIFTTHSTVKKTHDWSVDQLVDLFHKPTSTSSSPCSPHISNRRSTTSSPRMKHYGLSWI
jgi:hypothetical protein